MNARQLIAEFGKSTRLAGLALDDQGTCQLEFDGRTTVNVEANDAGDALCLAVRLGPLPAEGKAAIYGRLLEANLFGRETGGGTLAVLPAEGLAAICRTLEIENLEVDEFADLLAEFVRHARRWEGQLANGLQGADAPPELDDTVDFSTMIRV